jgi:FkbH-like protein
LSALRRATNAPVLLHALDYPRHPSLGVLDISRPSGQRHTIARINERLATVARELGAVYLVDMEALVQSVGFANWHDTRMELFARAPINRLALDDLARIYLRYIRSLAGYSRKCVVLDLDNTLWGGILGEDGPQGIKLGSEYPGSAYVRFQQALLNLRERGVLITIASKNNRHEVEEVFGKNPAMLLSLDHFSAVEVHWERKSLSVARIAEKVNLDPRHMVFVDDNPSECAEVQAAHPSLTVIGLPDKPETFVEALLSEGLFDTLTFSVEDTLRAQLYEQRDAAEGRRNLAASLDDYYRSLEMVAYIEPVNSNTLSRAAQLTQKTTQFNATTKRYTEADIRSRIDDKCWISSTMRLVDSFGDNGIVGLLLAHTRDDVWEIDTFLMSCRVINRTAETAMLHWLATEVARRRGAAIEGWIFSTDRNRPVRDVYERHGFRMVERTEEAVHWRLDLTEIGIPAPKWVRIINQHKE